MEQASKNFLRKDSQDSADDQTVAKCTNQRPTNGRRQEREQPKERRGYEQDYLDRIMGDG